MFDPLFVQKTSFFVCALRTEVSQSTAMLVCSLPMKSTKSLACDEVDTSPIHFSLVDNITMVTWARFSMSLQNVH